MSVLQLEPDTNEHLGAFSFIVVFLSFFTVILFDILFCVGTCRNIFVALKLKKINKNLIKTDQ